MADTDLSVQPRPPARYLLVEQLGKGGTGVVYRATRRDTGSWVALKLVPRSLPVRPFWRDHPPRLTDLNHPHLVRILATGTEAEFAWLEMEDLTGPVLRSLLSPGTPWPVCRCLHVTLALASALTYLHEHRLLHLDLKPENVLCPPDAPIKLADLDGLVPLGEVQHTVARGSLDYGAPEQRFGLPTDQRADLFSLAVLVYEMLTGRLPGRRYVPCRQWRPELPAAVEDVLAPGLARDRHDRPDSVADFASALTRTLTDFLPTPDASPTV